MHFSEEDCYPGGYNRWISNMPIAADRNELNDKNKEFVERFLPSFLLNAAGLPFPDKMRAPVRGARDKDLECLAQEVAYQERRSLATRSMDWAIAISDAMSTILNSVFDQNDVLGPAVRDVFVDNFKTTDLQTITLPDLEEEAPEGGAVEFSPLAIATAATGQISTYSLRMRLGRQVWQSQGGAIAQAMVDAGRLTRRLEARLLSELLVSNPTVNGSPLFDDPGPGSNSGACALSPTTLEDALDWLISYAHGDSYANLAPGALLVGPGCRAAAGATLRECAMESPIIQLAWLPAGSWYVLPRPTEHPVFARLRVAGSSGKPAVDWKKKAADMQIKFSLNYDIGFSTLSRCCYRGGVAP